MRLTSRMTKRTRRAVVFVAAVGCVTLVAPLGVASATTRTVARVATYKTPVAVIDAMSTSRYGTVLVVGGSSKLKGAPLYMISSDTPTSYGCTIAVKETSMGKITCTGPESDIWNNVQSDEWPAFVTNGQVPEVGPGVNESLVGLAFRPKIGWQVTYNHHPLYLFDPPSSPFKPVGENFLETVKPLPPWHGIWDLVASNGKPATGPATIETETLHGTTVLAAEAYNNAVHGGVAITVYAFSSSGGNQCKACYPTWIPVLTHGAPSAKGGASSSSLGTVKAPGLGEQVTYNGDPLYIYSSEMAIFSHGHPSTKGTKGNGNGKTDDGGTFAVVSP
jgi:hypothetical protein